MGRKMLLVKTNDPEMTIRKITSDPIAFEFYEEVQEFINLILNRTIGFYGVEISQDKDRYYVHITKIKESEV
jgi:hypothetical protein